jgi:autotransporter passenger strand-loop-strand repeat protein
MTTINSGQIVSGAIGIAGNSVFVDSGGTAVSATIEIDGSMFVDSGGTAVGTTINSGGLEVVSAGGTEIGGNGTNANESVIEGGEQQVFGLVDGVNEGNFGFGPFQFVDGTNVLAGSQVVESGGTALLTNVFIGSQVVESGGTTSNTQIAGQGTIGREVVSAGGTDVNALLAGNAEQDVFGLAIGALVTSNNAVEPPNVARSTQVVGSGGTTIGTRVSGDGVEVVLSGGTASNTTVGAGGTLELFGGATADLFGTTVLAAGATLEVAPGYTLTDFQVANGVSLDVLSGGTGSGTTISNGGLEVVESGGTASGTTINGGAREAVSAGGADISALIAGEQDVFGRASGATIIFGSEVVESGGTASGATVIVGSQIVESGGVTSGTTISALILGGVVFRGAETVASGGMASSTTISSSGLEVVSAGGTDLGAQIFGGEQDVFGVARGATVIFGSQVVESGGTASGTTVSSGGTLELFGGATADLFGTTVLAAGATLEIASGYTLTGFQVANGVSLDVLAGGTASGTMINSGGLEDVLSGGITSTTIINGGKLELANGASAGSGAITFAGSGGVLKINGTTMPTNVISGFVPGDTIDLAAVTLSSGGVVLAPGNVLKVTEGGVTYALQLNPSQNLSADAFALWSDGQGGTDVTVATPGIVEKGQTTVVGTVTPGLVGDTLTLVQAPGSSGTLSLGPVSGGVQQVIYTAPSSIQTSKIDAVSYTVRDQNNDVVGTGSPSVQLDAGPSITTVTPSVLENGQKTLVGTVTPGLAGDTLSLQQTGGSGTLALQLVTGVEEVIYTAPSTIAVSILDAISYKITDQHQDAVATGSNTVPIAPAGETTYVGTAGHTLTVGNSNSAIDGRAGNETITAGNGADVIFSGPKDTITAGNGADTIYSGANSNITAGTGNDVVTAGANSTIKLGNGNDKVTAGANNTITVGNGTDNIFAGANGVINLGTGHDTVAFGESPNPIAIGNETINGFNPAYDILQFNPALLSNYATALQNHDIKQVGANTVIQIDSTDSVTLDNVKATALTANNFHFS